MSATFRDQYFQQLPRRQALTINGALGAVGSIASIVALYFVFFTPAQWQSEHKFLFVAVFLTIIIFILVIYIVIRERGKAHRYAQAVFYSHYINHVIRDFISDIEMGKNPDLQQALTGIASAAATCFSVLTGRRCRCSIKEVTPKEEIETVARDATSTIEQVRKDASLHRLAANSDFEDLWYGRNGCYRYFFCNDLIELFRVGKYRNSSFVQIREPSIKTFLGFTWVCDWKLPYRSAIIWPIRYIPNHQYWPIKTEPGSAKPSPQDAPQIWGFLCIDCNARNAFDGRYTVELGAAWADALYTLFTVARYHREQANRASGRQDTQNILSTSKITPISPHTSTS